MEGRLDELVRVVAELQSGTVDVTHTPVHVRDEPWPASPHGFGSCRRSTTSGTGSWRRTPGSYRQRPCSGATVTGPPGATYAAEIGEDDVEEVEAFVPIDAPVVVGPGRRCPRRVSCRRAASAAVVHVGDLDAILDTYRTLGALVAPGRAARGRVRPGALPRRPARHRRAGPPSHRDRVAGARRVNVRHVRGCARR